MGFNTTVVILNDRLGDIDEDRDFGRRLAQAVFQQRGNKEPLDFGYGALIVEQHHADGTAVVAVGGNGATVLGYADGHRHRDPASQLKILRVLAAARGYRLVKHADSRKRASKRVEEPARG